MGAIPTYPTVTSGEALSSTKVNQISSAGTLWSKPVACLAYHSTAQTLTTGTWTAINLQSEVFDNVQSGDSPMHDNVTNNTRITIRTTGIYEVTGQVQFVVNSTAYRMARIVQNGSTILTENHQGAVPTVSTSVGITAQWCPLTAGDYIELFGYQASGGNLDTLAGRSVTFMQAVLVSSQ